MKWLKTNKENGVTTIICKRMYMSKLVHQNKGDLYDYCYALINSSLYKCKNGYLYAKKLGFYEDDCTIYFSRDKKVFYQFYQDVKNSFTNKEAYYKYYPNYDNEIKEN